MRDQLVISVVFDGCPSQIACLGRPHPFLLRSNAAGDCVIDRSVLTDSTVMRPAKLKIVEELASVWLTEQISE